MNNNSHENLRVLARLGWGKDFQKCNQGFISLTNVSIGPMLQMNVWSVDFISFRGSNNESS